MRALEDDLTRPLEDFAFYGPTCDDADYMKGPFALPADIQADDWIEIGMLGAYGAAMKTRFNGFGTAEAVTSLKAAERVFRRWLACSGNDHPRAPGYAAAWAEIYRADDWDGISYGDPVWRLTCSGPRGGITREAH